MEPDSVVTLNFFRTRQVAFVAAKPVAMTAKDRLEIKMRSNAQTTGNQAVTVRKFQIDTSNNPRWTALLNLKERLATVSKLRAKQAELKKIKGTSIPVIKERPKTAHRESRLFLKGLWLDKGEVHTAKVPDILNPQKAKPKNRLEMAQWMTSEHNPLTARVMANRLFAQLFGSGIVATLGDMGTTGLAPSNPELLDYLAVKFQKDYQWSCKKMLKEMVLSATYRQDNKASKELAQKDPRNEWLARGPRTRLSAEMMRDNALRVSGLLTQKVGGPSVMPPQPYGVWQSVYSGAPLEDCNRVQTAIDVPSTPIGNEQARIQVCSPLMLRREIFAHLKELPQTPHSTL